MSSSTRSNGRQDRRDFGRLIPVAFSAAALAVAVLGVTPLGSAAGSAAELAKQSVLSGSLSAVEQQKPRVVRGPRGRRGPRGPAGRPGPPGPQGDAGPQGERGAPGERGAEGERGPQGERGQAGTAIATRVRSIREVTTGDQPYPGTLWPTTGGVWTQRAQETDFLVGQVEVRYPAACDGSGDYPPYASLTLNLDGELTGSAYVQFYPGGAGTHQRMGVYFYPSNVLFAPGDDLTRAMTARVKDTCTGAGQDFTFTALKIDVISAS
jgi:Collagen triple helix repeat (20 copies)